MQSMLLLLLISFRELVDVGAVVVVVVVSSAKATDKVPSSTFSWPFFLIITVIEGCNSCRSVVCC